jgi:hypothetical protein
VVDVGVREHHGSYLGRHQGQGLAVAQAQLFEALKQAAIHQHTVVGGLQEKA